MAHREYLSINGVAELMTTKANMTASLTKAGKRSLRHVWISALVIVAIIALPALKSFAQRPSEPPGVDASDWQRTGAFPANFLFGVATASHQVEGNNTKNDWAIFEERDDVAASGKAVNHRNPSVLAQDLDRAKSLGINAYRFSIEWSRVEPTKDNFAQEEINYYKQVVDMARARGMRPIVGLHHFTLPNWLLDPNDRNNKPGWGLPPGGVGTGVIGCLSTDVTMTVNQFIEFVAKMADELGSRVDYWTTFNEPNGQAAGGYVAGVWSPGRGLLPEWDSYQCAVNSMILTHRLAFRTLKQRDTIDADGDGKAALVGAVQNVKPIFPAAPGTADDQDARDWDYVLQKQFLDAITPVFNTGPSPAPAYARSSRSSGFNCWDTNFDYTCDGSTTTESFLDFIGLNYYNPAVSYGSVVGALNPSWGDVTTGGINNSILQTNARQGRPASDFSEEVYAGGPWEIFPEGLLCVLRDLWARYQLPILITENGMAEIGSKGLDLNLTKRPAFIVSHLQMALRAISEGIPVLGYIHWTLVDNFEWREAYDTRAKFGLWHVSFNKEEIPPFQFGQPLGQASFKEQDPSLRDSSGNYKRTETPGAIAFREIAQARAITPRILQRWGSFPRFLGDLTVASAARRIRGPVDFPPDFRLNGTEAIASLIPSGYCISDIDVMITDGAGNPRPQDVNLHQGGRVAYTHLQPFNIRLEITESSLGTNNGRVVVRWSRDSPTAAFSFRLFYRLADCNGAVSAIYVDQQNDCKSPSGARQCASGSGGAFQKVADGVQAISPRNMLFIRAGAYNEPITINKPMEIRSYDGMATIGR